jgi:hypothetical protein
METIMALIQAIIWGGVFVVYVKPSISGKKTN